MRNKVIRLVRPVENSAEKEYIKEFFRFIGCFFSDITIDVRSPNDWEPYLQPNNERGNVEILINFFGRDPYLQECQIQGITRIYCYLSFDQKYAAVRTTPLSQLSSLPNLTFTSKVAMRTAILKDLINTIWIDDLVTCQCVRNIEALYTGNPRGDLFHYLQVKRSIQFLTMSEVLNEPAARVRYVRLTPYLMQGIAALWFMFLKLGTCVDPYSRYARVKAASMITSIAKRLSPDDRNRLNAISFPFFSTPFQVFTPEQLLVMLQELVGDHPEFWSAYLRMAALCRNAPKGDRSEALCYLRVLHAIPRNQRDYAFIWHRCGYYYEKKDGDIAKAKEYYQAALKVDPEYYQSLFKLGYFAASEGRFKEAETLLNRTIQAIFCGRSTEPDADGRYENWLALSLKDSQYVFKAYMMLAKIAIRSDRDISARTFIGKACMAATKFELAGLVYHLSDSDEYREFNKYHIFSEPVWAMWKVLKPWSEGVVRDDYIYNIVQNRLQRWLE